MFATLDLIKLISWRENSPISWPMVTVEDRHFPRPSLEGAVLGWGLVARWLTHRFRRKRWAAARGASGLRGPGGVEGLAAGHAWHSFRWARRLGERNDITMIMNAIYFSICLVCVD